MKFRSILPLILVVTLMGCNNESNDSNTPQAPEFISELDIPDDAFKQCISSTAASKGWSSIEDVTEIRCRQKGVKTISGIEVFVNLEHLMMNNHLNYIFEDQVDPLNTVTDLSPLAELTQLKELHLYGNAVTSIDALENLSQLTIVDLAQNKLKSIASLRNKPELETLYAESNRIETLPSFESNSKLTSLYLSDNDIEGVTGLSGLSALESLELDSNELGPAVNLPGLSSLKLLDISNNQISEIQLEDSQVSLQIINISQNQFESLDSLLAFSNLTSLSASDNLIHDLSGIGGLTHLSSLWLSRNQIQDITPLTSMTQLESLSLSENNLGVNELLDDALIPLRSLTELESLELNKLGSNTTDQALVNLAGLTKMRFLDLEYLEAPMDLSHLANMSELISLVYTNGGFSSTELDISPLSGLKNLTLLDLYAFKLSQNSASTLEGMKDHLEKLVIEFHEEEWLKNALPKLDSLNILELTYAMNDTGTYTGLGFLADMDQVGSLTLRPNAYGFSNSRKIDASSLKDMAELQTLNLEFIGIESPEPLRGLSQLESLSIWNVSYDFVDASVMETLTNIKYLDILSTPVSDLSFIRQFSQLQVLKLNHLTINNLDDLTGLNRLEELDIESSNVSADLTPIESLTQLKLLKASGTGLNCEDVEGIRGALPATLIAGIDDCEDLD